LCFVLFFNATTSTVIYTLSLHDALPISATEVFNLRSKCAELGEKIMKNTVIGDELKKEQLSHYEPKTNRCYVRLTVWKANLGKRSEEHTSELQSRGHLVCRLLLEKKKKK